MDLFIDSLQNQLKDTLLLLTFHDSRMGTPADFFTPAIQWRSESYYAWSMGGGSINGAKCGNVRKATSDSLRIKQIDQSATFTFSSVTQDQQRLSADITAVVTAVKPIPAGTRFHVAVFETNLNMIAIYGDTTANGQKNIYNIVRELLTDSTGVRLDSLSPGQTFSITRRFVLNPKIMNADSMRVAAWLQNDTGKTISAAMRSNESAVPKNIGIISKKSVKSNTFFSPIWSGHNTLAFTAPFKTVLISLCNAKGQTFLQKTISASKGENVRVVLKPAATLGFIKLRSADGKEVIASIMFR